MIVGLVGFIGSGKNLAGEILRENYSFIPESFAKSVKDLTAELFGWDRLMLEGSTEESRKWREEPDEFWSKKFGKDFSPRLALQLFGTEVGRQVFHKDLWIYSLEKRLKSDFNYVITDVRFPNEIDFIHHVGGVIINVQRGELPEWYDVALTANTTKAPDLRAICESDLLNNYKIHESEWAWIGSNIDYVVENNSTPEYLESELEKIINLNK